MIYFTSLSKAEEKHAHLNSLLVFHKHKDNPHVDDALNILIDDAKAELDRNLQRVHDDLSRANIIGKKVIFDSHLRVPEILTVEYVTVWHIHGTTDSGLSIGLPISNLTSMEFFDRELEAEYRARRRTEFRERVAHFRARQNAKDAAERRAMIERDILREDY